MHAADSNGAFESTETRIVYVHMAFLSPPPACKGSREAVGHTGDRMSRTCYESRKYLQEKHESWSMIYWVLTS